MRNVLVRNVIAILMMIPAAVLLFSFSVLIIASFSEITLGIFIFMIFILLIPGVLLLYFSIKLLKSKKYTHTQFEDIQANRGMNKRFTRSHQNRSAAATDHSFNPFDADSVNNFVQQQMKQGNMKAVQRSNNTVSETVVTTSSFSSSTSNESSSNSKQSTSFTVEDEKAFNELFDTFFDNKGGIKNVGEAATAAAITKATALANAVTSANGAKAATSANAAKEATVPKEPISVDCSGCGAKTTVLPKQSTKCEYCGTAVHYKEK